MSEFTIYTPSAIPAKKGGSRRSKFPIQELLVGQAFNVSAEDCGGVRSIIRAKKVLNPTLNIITRAHYDADGKPTGSFMVVRLEDLQPTTPATPAA